LTKTPKKTTDSTSSTSGKQAKIETSAAQGDVDISAMSSDASERLLQKAAQVERAVQSFQEESRQLAQVAEIESAVSRMDATLTKMNQVPVARWPGDLPTPTQQGCSETSCVTTSCCRMELVFKRVRMISGQTGVDAIYDAESTTGLAGALGGMEVLMHATLDGVGIVIPNQIWGYMKLTKRKSRPGVWHEVDRVVNTVLVPQGQKKSFSYVLQAVEKEEGTAETIAQGRPEFGVASGSFAFDCCCDTITHTVPISLEGGGRGGGELEVLFEIRRAS
jgi:hypothetical protein